MHAIRIREIHTVYSLGENFFCEMVNGIFHIPVFCCMELNSSRG